MDIEAKLGSLIFIVSLASLLLFLPPCFASSNDQNFLQCLKNYFPNDHSNQNQITNFVYDHANCSYSSILHFSMQNLRFNTSQAPKPQYIITPKEASHVQALVICSKKHGLQVRTRSGGHDYEGLSYTSHGDDHTPFVVIDLFHLRSISVDLDTKTAWVEAGATIGELYYEAGEKSNGKLGFPAGTCHTVGVGGHFSGGGQGLLMRKYGLSCDNVVDAVLVNANGEVVDRESMGEDLFWAIRGGGGASFGVILKWKVNLVLVPPHVTFCDISKTLAQGATNLVHQWQHIAQKFHMDLNMRLIVFPGGNEPVKVLFDIFYLGTIDQLMPLLKMSFPDLGMEAKNCAEMSWLKSTVENRSESIETLKDRNHVSKGFFFAKSDFFKKPIPKRGLEAIWKMMHENQEAVLIWDPYGGKMSEILESHTPFPYRKGTLFNVQYFVKWQKGGVGATKKHLDWINKIYSLMGPYASKNPRAAYLNYRDLSLGLNRNGRENSYKEARVWGDRYFKKRNFKRLALVKAKVDPDNFFRDEQSIPPLFS